MFSFFKKQPRSRRTKQRSSEGVKESWKFGQSAHLMLVCIFSFFFVMFCSTGGSCFHDEWVFLSLKPQKKGFIYKTGYCFSSISLESKHGWAQGGRHGGKSHFFLWISQACAASFFSKVTSTVVTHDRRRLFVYEEKFWKLGQTGFFSTPCCIFGNG